MLKKTVQCGLDLQICEHSQPVQSALLYLGGGTTLRNGYFCAVAINNLCGWIALQLDDKIC